MPGAALAVALGAADWELEPEVVVGPALEHVADFADVVDVAVVLVVLVGTGAWELEVLGAGMAVIAVVLGAADWE